MPEREAQEQNCECCEAPLALDEQRTLTLRHILPADEQALRNLYAGLSVRDLQHRFFSGGAPNGSFTRRWAALEEQGGLGLVAEISDGSGLRLVAEAGYALLDDGDAELGITIDAGHRGWLGPWMLDSLMTHAKQAGIRNLQAVVLTGNRAMLALARKRGYVILEHPDWGKVRVAMSTDGHQPSWPKKKLRPRILIESNRTRLAAEEELRRQGLDLAICTGPCTPLGHCPVIAGEPCPLVEEADAVIVDFPADDPMGAQLLEAERIIHPDAHLIEGSKIGEDGKSRHLTAEEILESLADFIEAPDSESDSGS